VVSRVVIGTLTTDKTYFWTRKGLKKPRELDKDLILGVDRSGDICWRKALQVNKHDTLAKCQHIISDSTEIHVPDDVMVCIQSASRRITTAKEIGRDDKLRMISNPAYVLEYWNRDQHNVSVDYAFVLGMAYRRIVINGKKMIIKVPQKKSEEAYDRIIKKLSLVEDSNVESVNVEHGPVLGYRNSPWSWLVIEFEKLPSIFESICNSSRDVPLTVRLHPELYLGFMEGLIFVLSADDDDAKTFETFPNEVEARKLLYNFFFLYGIECKTRVDPSYSPDRVLIKIKKSEFKRAFEKPSLGQRGKKSVSKIRWIFGYNDTMYKIIFEGRDWSPIIDLVYIL
jgi:hypothetical protein